MFHANSLAKLGQDFPYYDVILPPSLWFKFDRNLQSKKSQLVELILRNISQQRDDHHNAANFNLIYYILENNTDNYLNNSEISEIKKTKSFILAFDLFHANRDVVDFSSEEYQEAASNSFVKNKNRRIFGSKIVFRLLVCLECAFGLLFNKPIILWPLPILLLALNVDALRWVIKGIIDYNDVALYAFFWVILSFVFIVLLALAASVFCNLLMFPYFTFLYMTDPIRFELNWGLYKMLTLNDFTPYVAYSSSLIFYVMLIYYCRKALKGYRMKEFIA